MGGSVSVVILFLLARVTASMLGREVEGRSDDLSCEFEKPSQAGGDYLS